MKGKMILRRIYQVECANCRCVGEVVNPKNRAEAIKTFTSSGWQHKNREWYCPNFVDVFEPCGK